MTAKDEAPKSEIILYHYTVSPFAKRLVWYLNFRKIPYTQCLQPIYLPRPTLQALGTSYRRIPILSIGRDIYLDSRLIISILAQLYPPSPSHPSLAPPSPTSYALQRLLENYIVSEIFTSASALLPTSLPLLNDPKFITDREDYTGRSWSKDAIERARPEALIKVRAAFELLENTLLSDGRHWIVASNERDDDDHDKPSLLDIEAIWPLLWLRNVNGALPPPLISATQYPRVFAWMDRFDTFARESTKSNSAPRTIHGEEAIRITRGARLQDLTMGGKRGVEGNDPTGLKEGDMVAVWPTDSGFNHKDQGRLVTLNAEEVVIESEMTGASQGQGTTEEKVRIHCPRRGFRICRLGEAKL